MAARFRCGFLSPSCGQFMFGDRCTCLLFVSTVLHAFVFLRHVGCVPRAPPSKTAFDTFNTNVHRRVRCAALGPNTKSSQRQRNCVLTAHRHTAKTKTAAVWRNSHVDAHGHTSTKQTKDLRRSLGHWHLSWACWKGVTCCFLARLEWWWFARYLGLGALACDM